MKNILIVGGGFVSLVHADAYKKIKNANIVAVVDTLESSAVSFSEKYGCKYFLDMKEALSKCQIDIVDICLPTYLHEKYVIEAMEHKKHVICEKPFAITLEEADNMIEASKKNNVKFMIAQVLRFWAEYEKIKEFVDNKTLGDVNFVSAVRLTEKPKPKWFDDPKKSGGGVIELHCHDIDFLMHVFGRVKSVYAIGKQNYMKAWDYVSTSIGFENGVKASVEGMFGMTRGYPFTSNLRVIGSEGSAEYSLSAGVNIDNMSSSQNKLMLYKNDKEPLLIEISNEPYKCELEYFINCVENDKDTSVVNINHSREVLYTLLMIKKSLETGEVVFSN